MLGACMPKKAKGSLPTIIRPINTSLKTDRKDAMCLSKEKKNSSEATISHLLQNVITQVHVYRYLPDTKSKL